VKLRLFRVMAVQLALATFQTGGYAANPPNAGELAGPARVATPPEDSEVHRARQHRIPFRVEKGLVYVEAEVQGKPATLLVDSGAALTTFSQEKIPAQRAASKITISMARGSVVARRQEVRFSLGESRLRDQHCEFSRSAIVGDFQFMGADGVVGLDVLSTFQSITFDFANSILILEDK